MKQSILSKLKSKLKQTTNEITLSFSQPKPSWYKETFTREQAEDFLFNKQIGVFVMRKSETIIDCFVLSVKVPKFINTSQVSHYLVVKDKKTSMYSVRGFQKEFTDLKSLVTHCSVMRDILPITLDINHGEEHFNQMKLNEFDYYSSSDESSLMKMTSKSSLDSTMSLFSSHSSSSLQSY